MKATTILLALCAAPLVGTAAVPPLDEAAFEELHARLQPPADEAWRGLPWQPSVLGAQALAAAERKPVYMLVRSGNPLGCV